MPEGMTATTDPEGIRRETRFQYEYAQPPDLSGMNGIDWDAVQENVKNHGVDDALKYARAAIVFQGTRGFQRDVAAAQSEPDPIKRKELEYQAGLKWHRLLFADNPNAAPPFLRALTPPAITPYQAERLKFERERLNKPVPIPPNQVHKSGQDIVVVNPRTGEIVKRINPPVPTPSVTESVRQVQNKAFDPSTGATNVPPFLSVTNRTVRNIPPPPPPAPGEHVPVMGFRAMAERISPPASLVAESAANPPTERITKAAPTNALPAGTTVLMTNPKGQVVHVPQSQVERAKKLGYK